MKSKPAYFILFIAFFGFATYISSSLKIPELKISEKLRRYNTQDKVLYLHMGLKRFWSSLIWVQSLIHADHEQYKGEALNSWLFLRFKTITDLDPKFLEAYRYGGLYLSVVKDDMYGASFIFERGVQWFPRDYILNLYAGYHFYTELGLKEKGLKYFTAALYNSKGRKRNLLMEHILKERLPENDQKAIIEFIKKL